MIAAHSCCFDLNREGLGNRRITLSLRHTSTGPGLTDPYVGERLLAGLLARGPIGPQTHVC